MASPGLNEITTTTKQNRSGVKKAQKTAQAGVPVPAKAFSSEKKEAAAAGKSSSAPMPEKKSWEGSTEDWMADHHEARRRGQKTEDYEDSARDRVSDVAGQMRMDAKGTEKNASEAPDAKHYRGKPAFANAPKNAHGFGHSSSSHDGHLRNSGHSGAHRIGKKR
jgi:hypothetical protein